MILKITSSPTRTRVAQCLNRRTSRLGIFLLTWLVLVPTTLALAGPGENGARSNSFRVMTYNIHHGEGTDGRVDLERIALLILRQEADLVALQEVDRGVLRTQRRDLPAELAELTGMSCVFSNNFHYQGGEYGNAILTRYPVNTGTNRHYTMLREGEQRGLLQVEVTIEGRNLLFCSTHLDYRPDPAERLSNVRQVREWEAVRGDRTLIVAGDFNALPGSPTHVAMKSRFSDAWEVMGDGDGFTFPSRGPDRRIDYIFINQGASVRPVRAWVVCSEASDHCGLVVEMVFSGEH